MFAGKSPSTEPKTKESRASSASELLKFVPFIFVRALALILNMIPRSLFGNETSDDAKMGGDTEGYGYDVIQALFGATKRLNVSSHFFDMLFLCAHLDV